MSIAQTADAAQNTNDAGERAYWLAMCEAEADGEVVDWNGVFAVMDATYAAVDAAQDSADAADYPACADGRW